MPKFALPQLFVPGASPRMSDEGVNSKHMRDKKRRYLWNMPKPSGIHTTKQVGRVLDKSDPDHPRVKKVMQDTQFPVYRAYSASMARYGRSQYRRAKRKAAAIEAARKDAEGPFDTAASLIKSVLNPTGGQ